MAVGGVGLGWGRARSGWFGFFRAAAVGACPGSGVGGELPDPGEGFDECVGPRVAAGQAQVELAGVAHNAAGDVEEREAQSFGPAAVEWFGQGENLHPASGVVGERARVPPQPVPVEVVERRVVQPEVFFQAADGVFGEPATQPVMMFDPFGGERGGQVGDDGVEPPAIEIIERQLFVTAHRLAAHDQPEPQRISSGGRPATDEGDLGLSDLRTQVVFMTQRPTRRRGGVG